jgi:hypothetical protein
MDRSGPGRDEVLFWLGVGLWVAVIAVTWPRALSFGDEIDYLVRARGLLAGHVSHAPHDPGLWFRTPSGPVARFPLPFSALLAPLAALGPRAVFALGVLSAVWLARTARDMLASWGASPLWALLILAHPTIVILSRTAMADVPLATACVCAWWALRRGRTGPATAWLALLVALKPTGAVLAAAVVGGEVLTHRRALRARDGATWRRILLPVLGGAAGMGVVLATNHLDHGTFSSGYALFYQWITPFSPAYLSTSAPKHLVSLLVQPPLLFAGAWAFWRRREPGPLLVIGGYLGLLCVFFYADWGATPLETLVLSPRLILPVVAFLLVGYGAGLDGGARRLLGDRAFDHTGRARPWLAALLLAVPVAVCGAVSARHARFQQPMARALATASREADSRGGGVLGVTRDAAKVGVLYHGRTTLYDGASNRPTVVLCNEAPASHRLSTRRYSCVLDGYSEIGREDGFVVLARSP